MFNNLHNRGIPIPSNKQIMNNSLTLMDILRHPKGCPVYKHKA